MAGGADPVPGGGGAADLVSSFFDSCVVRVGEGSSFFVLMRDRGGGSEGALVAGVASDLGVDEAGHQIEFLLLGGASAG